MRFKIAGFTLIELLLFLGIFSILSIAMLELLVSVFDVQLESQSTTSIVRDGEYILKRISYDVKNADSVSAPSIGSQSSTLTVTRSSQTYTYASSSGNLMLNNSSVGTNERINSIDTSIVNLNFKRLATSDNAYSTITVTLNLKSNTTRRGGNENKTFIGTFGTR